MNQITSLPNINVGIDFSINSPGVILSSGIFPYQFLNVCRAQPAEFCNARKYEFHRMLDQFSDVTILFIPHNSPGKTYSEKERNKLMDGLLLTDTIGNWIYGWNGSNNQISFTIEGFAFGASGNRLAELAGYQYLLRERMLSTTGSPEQISVYAPATIKATAAKGRPDKDAMIQAFLDNSLNDPLLPASEFFNDIISNTTLYQKGRSWKKPVDDLVDAYWILKTHERITLSSILQ